ncbi:unnamed protein product [Rhizoctonia solani]|uniref:YDG domain-containing protein n=1 Tax=Rhizoctonia solani TaxID=456999 RepID=A0A8H3BWE3_9AGAM|nr:unnamed protein product [Rhizoctonia solani]CAE6481312.1 unnamed protein product [Rhizoctonia solani]
MLNNEKLLQELMGQSMDLPTGLAAGFAAPKPKATKPKIEKEELEERVERERNGTRRSARQACKPSVSFAGDGEGIVDRAKMPKMVLGIDMGDAFTYTGSGGRDLKETAKNPKNVPPTSPQSLYQSFKHSFNKSLKISSETRKPVRVIRGYKLPGVYAPESGYWYDGLYIVERVWMDRVNNQGVEHHQKGSGLICQD